MTNEFGEYDLKIRREGGKLLVSSSTNPRFVLTGDTMEEVLRKACRALKRYEQHILEHPSFAHH